MRLAFDSINAGSVPVGGSLYMGYDDGKWPDAAALAARFPFATVIRITTNPNDNEGDMLDVESGDATPGQAPGWVQKRRAAGHGGPLVYFPDSWRDSVVQSFHVDGVPLPGLFAAAYPGKGPNLQQPGDVGHQYIDVGPYDISVVVDHLPGIDPGTAPSPPAGGTDMQIVCTDPTSGGTWSTDGNGDLYPEFGAPFVQGLNQHPNYGAGGAESGGKNPCIGIAAWRDSNGQWGVVYFTFDWHPDPDGSPYHKYRFRRDGTPD